ncbi:globin [Phenylobacterium sp.]|uniref:globin n=1 Tax=Phenylobacterium sp. TaxID=1871053 RepID=UPI00393B86D8
MTSAEDPVTRSLDLVAERVGDPAPLVYGRLFRDYPETEPLFWRDTQGAVRGEMLARAFECLLDLDGAYAQNMIRAERVNHVDLGVPAEAFANFFRVIRDACRDVLAGDWTAETDAAWDRLLVRLDGLVSTVPA